MQEFTINPSCVSINPPLKCFLFQAYMVHLLDYHDEAWLYHKNSQIENWLSGNISHSGAFSSGSEAPVSDPAAVCIVGSQSQPLLVDDSPGSALGSPDKRVQFTAGEIGKIPEDDSQNDVFVSETEEKKKHRKK